MAVGSGAVLTSCLLAACNEKAQQAGNVVDVARNASIEGSGNGSTILSNSAIDLRQVQGTGGAENATSVQRQWLAQATAFMNRPEQQRDVQTALRARASTHPAFCSAATFVPKRIDIAFDPAPQFTDDGTFTRGTVVYRATMQGCSMPVLLTVYLDSMPGMPLRFRAGLAGTTFADPDLQERALPYAADAAKALLTGCARVAPIDTRLIGASPSASGRLVPWSEYWLMSGCGQFVSTKLDFTPDHAANQTLVHADPSASRLVRSDGVGAASTGGPVGADHGGPTSSASSAPAPGRVVASATGTSRIPLGGAAIPGAKVAGTCLFRLRETAPTTAPDHAECLSGLPARAGATTACSASRRQAKGQMDVAVTNVDSAGGMVTFQCTVRAQ